MNKPNKTLRLTRTTCTTLGFAVATFGAININTCAQTNAETAAPHVHLAQTHHLRATVENIDYAKREVTLKGPEGNTVQITVSDAVKNFPQMKKGDDVNVGYYESIALAVAKPGEPLTPTSRSEALATREPGQKPGGVAVSVTDTTATVEDIDRDKREVTLKDPAGNIFNVIVDPSVGNLERIKKGDRITASRTEALAISVEAPEPKSSATNSEPK